MFSSCSRMISSNVSTVCWRCLIAHRWVQRRTEIDIVCYLTCLRCRASNITTTTRCDVTHTGHNYWFVLPNSFDLHKFTYCCYYQQRTAVFFCNITLHCWHIVIRNTSHTITLVQRSRYIYTRIHTNTYFFSNIRSCIRILGKMWFNGLDWRLCEQCDNA